MARQLNTKQKKSRLAAEIREPLKETDAEALLNELTATVVNEALQAELTEHLDYESGEEPPEGQSVPVQLKRDSKRFHNMLEPGVHDGRVELMRFSGQG